MTKNEVRRLINEEVKTSDVHSIVNSKIDSLLRNREFEDRVCEITAKAVSKLFKLLYDRRSMWESGMK